MHLPTPLTEALGGRFEDMAETQEDPAFFQGLATDPERHRFVHWQLIFGKIEPDAAFEEQLKILQALEHPYLARFHERAALSQGTLIVTDLPEGVLFSKVEETQRDELYWEWLVQALERLRDLHRIGWLHLAQNEDSWLLVPPEGESGDERMFLTDLCVFPDRPLGGRIQAGSLVAAPPEIWTGAPLDGRADLYALAALFLRQRNRGLFARFDTPKKLVDLHRGGRMADFVPKTPSRLNDLLRRMLQANPQERPASAEACLREMQGDAYGVAAGAATPPLAERTLRRQASLVLTTLHSMIQEGEWQTAEAMLQEVRPHFQESYGVYLDYLETYLVRHQDPRKLWDQEQEGVELDPRLKILFSLERAVGKARLGEASAALDILNEAEEAAQDYPDPEVHARVLLKRARLLREKFYEASAMEEFFLAYEKTRNVTAGRLRLSICSELADLFVQNGLDSAAEVLLREAIGLAADQPEFQARLKVLLALALTKRERWEEAAHYFSQAKSVYSSAKLAEDLAWASAHEMRFHLAKGDYAAARREWKILQARARNLNVHGEWLLRVQALVWMESGELPSPETETDVSPLVESSGNFSELGWGREDNCRLLARLARRLGREDVFEAFFSRAEKLKAGVARSLDRFRAQEWKWEGPVEDIAAPPAPPAEPEEKARQLEEENRRLQEELQKLAASPPPAETEPAAPPVPEPAPKAAKPSPTDKPEKSEKAKVAASADREEGRKIEECLRRHRGNREKTAKELGINRRTLFAKLEKFNLKDLTFGPTREEVEAILAACGGKKNEAAKKMKMSRATFYRYLKDLGL